MYVVICSALDLGGLIGLLYACDTIDRATNVSLRETNEQQCEWTNPVTKGLASQSLLKQISSVHSLFLTLVPFTSV